MNFKSSMFLLGCCCLVPGCDDTATPPAAEVEQPPVVAQKAVAGVGKEGQSLKDNTGVAKIISGPASALFDVKQRAVLEFQIPPLVQMFKASEGRFPKSHEEFMTKIVDSNRLVLPELPAGAVYHFDSSKGELWVYPEGEVPE